MSTPSRTWIVIVNYRTADLVVNCLRSLADEISDLGGGKVVVIDNASSDGSAPTLIAAIKEENWQGWVSVLPLERNGGFAFGNNAGIKVAQASPGFDYLYLLNPDTLVRPKAIKALVSFMDGHPAVGIAGSQLENNKGGVECSAHRFPSPWGELADGARLGVLSTLLKNHLITPPLREEAHSCDWVSGAGMIIRRKVFEEIGYMDENYFLYYEEVDFCRRAKMQGWGIWYVPTSRIMHIEGAATGIQVGARRRPAYWYNSRRRYFITYYGVAGLVLTDVLWSLARLTYLFRRILRLGAQGAAPDPKWFMWDILWGDLRSIFSGQAWRARRIMRKGK